MSRKERKRLFLVDGYNVLRSGGRYAQVPMPDYSHDHFNVLRERLLNDVVNYCGSDWEAIIVYDGEYSMHETQTEDHVGGVRIIFSAKGQSADRVIEKIAHDAKERSIETIVVTSDATIQDTVFGGGIDRMSAEGFCRELAAHNDTQETNVSPEDFGKRTVSDRIPDEVSEKLVRLRDELINP